MQVAAYAAEDAQRFQGAAGDAMSGYDYSFRKIDGGELPLSQWRGKPVLIVNTASECGFTPQYAGLEAVWQRYRDQGFVAGRRCRPTISARRSQAARPRSRISRQRNYKVDFPLAAKETVVGRQGTSLLSLDRRRARRRRGAALELPQISDRSRRRGCRCVDIPA